MKQKNLTTRNLFRPDDSIECINRMPKEEWYYPSIEDHFFNQLGITEEEDLEESCESDLYDILKERLKGVVFYEYARENAKLLENIEKARSLVREHFQTRSPGETAWVLGRICWPFASGNRVKGAPSQSNEKRFHFYQEMCLHLLMLGIEELERDDSDEGGRRFIDDEYWLGAVQPGSLSLSDRIASDPALQEVLVNEFLPLIEEISVICNRFNWINLCSAHFPKPWLANERWDLSEDCPLFRNEILPVEYLLAEEYAELDQPAGWEGPFKSAKIGSDIYIPKRYFKTMCAERLQESLGINIGHRSERKLKRALDGADKIFRDHPYVMLRDLGLLKLLQFYTGEELLRLAVLTRDEYPDNPDAKEAFIPQVKRLNFHADRGEETYQMIFCTSGLPISAQQRK